MHIEVLTVPDCQHRIEVLARLRDALVRIGAVSAIVTERVIDDSAEALAAGMTGSPTILVDGSDPFAIGPVHGSVSCRLYRSESCVEGAPSVDALLDALARSSTSRESA